MLVLKMNKQKKIVITTEMQNTHDALSSGQKQSIPILSGASVLALSF